MLFILLPAYNEEYDIGALLQRISEAMQFLNFRNYKVIAINDGSTDRTEKVVNDCGQAMPVEIINHAANRGLGKAMLTGLKHIAGLVEDEDVLITMDADNTHDPQLIGAMVEKIRSGASLVIASRYEQGGEEVGLSESRSFLSRGASSLLKIFFPILNVKDYTCGFRAYRGAALKRAFEVYGDHLVEEQGFTCMAEILIKFSTLHIRIDEVPLVLRYDLKSGQSKMKVLRTIIRYFVLISKNLFRRPVIMGQRAG
jgi:dolichol-phosphate mannosyltransferase